MAITFKGTELRASAASALSYQRGLLRSQPQPFPFPEPDRVYGSHLGSRFSRKALTPSVASSHIRAEAVCADPVVR